MRHALTARLFRRKQYITQIGKWNLRRYGSNLGGRVETIPEVSPLSAMSVSAGESPQHGSSSRGTRSRDNNNSFTKSFDAEDAVSGNAKTEITDELFPDAPREMAVYVSDSEEAIRSPPYDNSEATAVDKDEEPVTRTVLRITSSRPSHHPLVANHEKLHTQSGVPCRTSALATGTSDVMETKGQRRRLSIVDKEGDLLPAIPGILGGSTIAEINEIDAGAEKKDPGVASQDSANMESRHWPKRIEMSISRSLTTKHVAIVDGNLCNRPQCTSRNTTVWDDSTFGWPVSHLLNNSADHDHSLVVLLDLMEFYQFLDIPDESFKQSMTAGFVFVLHFLSVLAEAVVGSLSCYITMMEQRLR